MSSAIVFETFGERTRTKMISVSKVLKLRMLISSSASNLDRKLEFYQILYWNMQSPRITSQFQEIQPQAVPNESEDTFSRTNTVSSTDVPGQHTTYRVRL